MMDPSFESTTLTQTEIDALLSKLASGGDRKLKQNPSSPGRWLKSTAFRRPDKLSKDQMRTLQLIHETFGRLAGSSLSAYLRSAFNQPCVHQGVYGSM